MAVDYALVASLVPIDDNTDYDSIMVGNSKFTDDEWDLRPFITKKTTKDSHKYMRFDFIDRFTTQVQQNSQKIKK